MINKVFTMIIYFMLVCLLPLSADLSLLLSVQILVLFAAAAIIILFQPQFSIAETSLTKRNDKYSVVIIMAAYLLSQVIIVIEWGYLRKSFHDFSINYLTIIGILLIIVGTVIRIYSIKTLGKYFTGTVQVQQHQIIITHGAYKIVRHPSYLGALLSIAGSSVFVHAYIGACVTTLLMFGAYYYRIKVEEETLIRKFGQEYKKYQIQTKKLIPFIY